METALLSRVILHSIMKDVPRNPPWSPLSALLTATARQKTYKLWARDLAFPLFSRLQETCALKRKRKRWQTIYPSATRRQRSLLRIWIQWTSKASHLSSKFLRNLRALFIPIKASSSWLSEGPISLIDNQTRIKELEKFELLCNKLRLLIREVHWKWLAALAYCGQSVPHPRWTFIQSSSKARLVHLE